MVEPDVDLFLVEKFLAGVVHPADFFGAGERPESPIEFAVNTQVFGVDMDCFGFGGVDAKVQLLLTSESKRLIEISTCRWLGRQSVVGGDTGQSYRILPSAP